MELFIVLENKSWDKEPIVMEFVGVFDSIEKAEAACLGPNFMIGPATLNKEYQGKQPDWEGAYYPIPWDGTVPEAERAS